MTTLPEQPELDASLLAELHAARTLVRGSAAVPAAGRISVHALWAHVRRKPGEPVSFAIERALRTDERVSAAYRKMLVSMAVAHAPFAMAASDGAIQQRRVGLCELEIIETAGEAPLLVLKLNGVPTPHLVEISTASETLRLDLPPPAEGAIVLSLDPAHSEAAQLLALLRNPASEITLI
jgi:hypothetical protein